jgi:hypothetical protein
MPKIPILKVHKRFVRKRIGQYCSQIKTRTLLRKSDMPQYLYQIAEDTEEAEDMGGACSLLIVEKVYFEETGGIADDHILEDLVSLTGDPALPDTLDEVAEGMIVSQVGPDQTRSFLKGYGIFEEHILFEGA